MTDHPPATETPQNSPSQNLAWRAAELNRALALVRPVSMSDDTASDWLAAAVAETAEMSDHAFRAAVAKARKTCTYHGQIIPTVTAELVQKAKPDPFAWAMACHQPRKPVAAISDERGGPKRLGDVVKRIGPK